MTEIRRPEGSMSQTLQTFAASIDRLNALTGGDLSRLSHLPTARAYRLEMKTTLKLLRAAIAEEPRLDIRRTRLRQLRYLKKIHFNVIQLEAVSLALAAREN